MTASKMTVFHIKKPTTIWLLWQCTWNIRYSFSQQYDFCDSAHETSGI